MNTCLLNLVKNAVCKSPACFNLHHRRRRHTHHRHFNVYLLNLLNAALFITEYHHSTCSTHSRFHGNPKHMPAKIQEDYFLNGLSYIRFTLHISSIKHRKRSISGLSRSNCLKFRNLSPKTTTWAPVPLPPLLFAPPSVSFQCTGEKDEENINLHPYTL